ncbi:hypothetical protein C0J52_09143 [Blattella germanica]|nr:hypothetical protein C0J52_09143 [Blattella germanica]
MGHNIEWDTAPSCFDIVKDDIQCVSIRDAAPMLPPRVLRWKLLRTTETPSIATGFRQMAMFYMAIMYGKDNFIPFENRHHEITYNLRKINNFDMPKCGLTKTMSNFPVFALKNTSSQTHNVNPQREMEAQTFWTTCRMHTKDFISLNGSTLTKLWASHKSPLFISIFTTN